MADIYGAVTVDTTAGGTEIVANLSARRTFILKNNGSVVVYLGFDDSLTASNGMPIMPQESIEIGGKFVGRKTGIRGITESSSADVRYMTWDS